MEQRIGKAQMTTKKPTNPSHGELLDARIAEIQERESKATKGPWKVYPSRDQSRTVISGKDWFQFAEVVTRMRDAKEDNPTGVANADFIAHARADIPFLLEQLAELRSLILGKMGEGAEAYRLLGESYLREQAARTQLAEAELRVEEARKILDETRALARAAGLKAKVDINGWLLCFINERAEAEKRASHFLYIYHDQSLGYEQFWVMLKGKREKFLVKRFAEKGLAEEFLAEFSLVTPNRIEQTRERIEAEATASRLQSELEEARKEIVAANEAADKNSGLIDRWKDRAESLLGDGESWDDAEKAIAARLAAQPDVRGLEMCRRQFDNILTALMGDPPLPKSAITFAETGLGFCAAHLAPQAGVPNAQKTYDPIAELEYIAEEITGEDVAPEDLSGQLDFAIQVLKERAATASHTPRCPSQDRYFRGDGVEETVTYQPVRYEASQAELLRHLTKPSPNCTSEPDSDYSDGETPGPKEQE